MPKRIFYERDGREYFTDLPDPPDEVAYSLADVRLKMDARERQKAFRTAARGFCRRLLVVLTGLIAVGVILAAGWEILGW